MDISVKGFARKMLAAVKAKANDIGIQQGAAAICFAPSTTMASDWLGCLGNVTIVEPLYGCDDTIYRDENGKEVGDCAGVIAMKIAAAKRVKQLAEEDHGHPTKREELTSGSLPEELVGNGRINWKGAVAFPVGYLTGGYCRNAGVEAMTIYVAVSGGTQDQDEAAAWAALKTFRDIIHSERDNGWMVPRVLWEENDPDEKDSDETE